MEEHLSMWNYVVEAEINGHVIIIFLGVQGYD